MSDASPTPGPQPSELAELAGGLIHEIKNRVGTLSLNLQLLAEEFDPPETPRERKALERINRLNGECQKLADVASDFLRFARAQELSVEPTTLDAVVARMVDFLTPTARQQKIEIRWFASGDLPPVNLDRDLFDQCLLNLMLNAEQAMPDGGTLTLIGRLEERGGGPGPGGGYPGAPRPRGPSPLVCLDVIDTGHGIPPDQLPKLFRPFHTTKPSGHGLGLATTRKIVLAHGGTIGVQSEPGRGTKFTIRLPAASS